MAKDKDVLEIVNEIAKRRGFFWPSYEIYGGVAGFLTFGPLGALLKRNIEDKFRELFIYGLGFVEIESSVIVPEKVFQASGHLEHFREPMVECVKCGRRFRADHLLHEFAGLSGVETERMSLSEIKEALMERRISCPECGGEFGEPKYFLTMFTTTIGPYSKDVGYGRPEAAQNIFTEFKRLYEVTRGKLPIGIAVIGHALRNEISPRQGPIRLREFTIMDLELFFDPSSPECPLLKDVKDEVLRIIPAERRLRGEEEAIEVTVKEMVDSGLVRNEWLAFFMALAKRFLIELGIPENRQRFIEKLEWERAHYSAQGFDQEVLLGRLGWIEVSGHNYRTDYDLKRHMEHSGVDLTVYKELEKPRVIKEIVLKPNKSKIGPEFREAFNKVIRLLEEADPEEVEKSFHEKGFYMAGEYRILPEHVSIVKVRREIKGEKFIPHVIEPSFGSDRLVYATLVHSYYTKKGRNILKLPIGVAPIQVAVYPLVDKEPLNRIALEIFRELRREGFRVEYDASASIGRRYARADEIGVPLAITVDSLTVDEGTVTVRDRDSWRQVRVRREDLPKILYEYFKGKITFEEMEGASK